MSVHSSARLAPSRRRSSTLSCINVANGGGGAFSKKKVPSFQAMILYTADSVWRLRQSAKDLGSSIFSLARIRSIGWLVISAMRRTCRMPSPVILQDLLNSPSRPVLLPLEFDDANTIDPSLK